MKYKLIILATFFLYLAGLIAWFVFAIKSAVTIVDSDWVFSDIY